MDVGKCKWDGDGEKDAWFESMQRWKREGTRRGEWRSRGRWAEAGRKLARYGGADGGKREGWRMERWEEEWREWSSAAMGSPALERMVEVGTRG